MYGDGIIIVLGDAAPFARIEVGVPICICPGRAVEVEGIEVIIGRDRLPVGEPSIRVEAEVGGHAVFGYRPVSGETGNSF